MRRVSAGRADPSTIQEAAQLPRTAGVLQLAQGLGFDLADAFAGDAELLADLFEGVVGVHADAEAHAQHAFLAGVSEARTRVVVSRRLDWIAASIGRTAF